MRSVKPVVADDNDEDDDSTREPEPENESVPPDALRTIPADDLGVFPPCVGFEREEEIRDVGTFGALFDRGVFSICTPPSFPRLLVKSLTFCVEQAYRLKVWK